MDVARAIYILRKDSEKVGVHTDFIGDWPDERYRQKFSTFLSNKGIADHVTIHGSVSNRSDIKEALLSSDVFLLPTYYPEEAQPLSIIEAMNAATPVVATDHAAIPEYVVHGENGYLVEKQSPKEIAKSILNLNNFSEWKSKALSARKKYEKMHSHNSVKKQFLSTLDLSYK
jgi:glycosyltransferase involved in cell wall biosynthesis